MAKYTTTTPKTFINSVQSLDHSKSLDATHAPTAKDLNTSVQKLQPKTVNFARIPTNDDQTMYLSEEHPDNDDINSSTDSSTKPNPYNTDMRDRMIKQQK